MGGLCPVLCAACPVPSETTSRATLFPIINTRSAYGGQSHQTGTEAHEELQLGAQGERGGCRGLWAGQDQGQEDWSRCGHPRPLQAGEGQKLVFSSNSGFHLSTVQVSLSRHFPFHTRLLRGWKDLQSLLQSAAVLSPMQLVRSPAAWHARSPAGTWGSGHSLTCGVHLAEQSPALGVEGHPCTPLQLLGCLGGCKQKAAWSVSTMTGRLGLHVNSATSPTSTEA